MRHEPPTLVLRGRHALEDDLEVVDLSDSDAELVREPVGDGCLACPGRAPEQEHLP
jgi:hypothetical protein